MVCPVQHAGYQRGLAAGLDHACYRALARAEGADMSCQMTAPGPQADIPTNFMSFFGIRFSC